MKFALNMTCKSAAFFPQPRDEVIRILREVADRLERGEYADIYRTIFDVNGNGVGCFKLSEFI